MCRHSLAPAVVYHHLVLAARFVEQPCQQLFALPVLGGHVPFAVAEDDGRLIAGHHVLELREEVLVDEPLAVAEPERVVPLVEGIVEAELQPAFSRRRRELGHQVAVRPGLDGVPGPAPIAARLGAGPEAETLVVLRGGHDVPRPGAGEDIGPLVGVEQFRTEFRGEVLVVERFAVVLLVELPPNVVRLLVMHIVPVPLGILSGLAPGRHRVHAPVDEDAEFGVAEPLRAGAFVERFPFRLERVSAARADAKKCARKTSPSRAAHRVNRIIIGFHFVDE